MTVGKRLRFWAIILIVLSACVVVATRAEAQGECNGHSCNDGGGVDVDVTTGPNNISVGGAFVSDETSLNFDSKAYALAAPGLGDVDIAQCLGSEAWTLLVGGKQKLVLNQVCMSEFYLKQGRYDLAAQSLCNQPEILNEYETEADCENDHDFTPTVVAVEIIETFDTEQKVQDESIEVVQIAQNEIYDRLAALEQKPAPRPRVVQAQPPERYSEDQIKAVWAALGKGGGDEDE